MLNKRSLMLLVCCVVFTANSVSAGLEHDLEELLVSGYCTDERVAQLVASYDSKRHFVGIPSDTYSVDSELDAESPRCVTGTIAARAFVLADYYYVDCSDLFAKLEKEFKTINGYAQSNREQSRELLKACNGLLEHVIAYFDSQQQIDLGLSGYCSSDVEIKFLYDALAAIKKTLHKNKTLFLATKFTDGRDVCTGNKLLERVKKKLKRRLKRYGLRKNAFELSR